jgi:hypothetical protein
MITAMSEELRSLADRCGKINSADGDPSLSAHHSTHESKLNRDDAGETTDER